MMFSQEEQRFTNLLCEYWNKIKGDRRYPDVSDIRRDDIVDIWEHCFIIEHVAGKYTIAHLGGAIKEAYESDLNIASDGPIISFDDVENIQEYLDEVLESGEAVIEQSECDDLNGNKVKFRQCFLPLGANSDKVDAVIGALRYKIVEV